MFEAKKRFIAGAVCPRCGQMDKLVMYQEGGKQFRECVSCDFHDEMRFPDSPSELATRVNRGVVGKGRDQVKPVKLINED